MALDDKDAIIKTIEFSLNGKIVSASMMKLFGK